jgi:hypothetical protein
MRRWQARARCRRTTSSDPSTGAGRKLDPPTLLEPTGWTTLPPFSKQPAARHRTCPIRGIHFRLDSQPHDVGFGRDQLLKQRLAGPPDAASTARSAACNATVTHSSSHSPPVSHSSGQRWLATSAAQGESRRRHTQKSGFQGDSPGGGEDTEDQVR